MRSDARETGAAARSADDLSPTRHRGDIQGLRAVAVLLVALNHAGVGFLKGGYIGVDVFFVLSGYLITGILLTGARRDGRVSLVDFYVRRARRILPAATLTLATTAVASYYLLNVVRAKQALTDVVWATFFAANVRDTATATNYFAQGQPPSPVQHFWSLAVEEQFYVVWPTVLALVIFGWGLRRVARHHQRSKRAVTERAVRRLLVVIVVIVAASLFWSIHQTRSDPTVAYFSTFTRAWELGLGAGLAIVAHRLARAPGAVRVLMGWVGLAAIVVAAVGFSARTPFPGAAALLPTIGAALLIAAGIAGREPRAAVSRVLSITPMRYIGDRSYTFYLWHWPVLVLINEHYGPLSTPTKLLLLAAAFGLSIITYVAYENPLHRGEWGSTGVAARALWFCAPIAVILVAGFYQGKIDSKALAATTQQSIPGPTAVPTPGEAAAQLRREQQELANLERGGRTQAPLPAVLAAATAADNDAAIPGELSPSPATDPQFSDDIYNPGCTLEPGAAQTTGPICRMGDPRASRTMVVFGDSHAQMWMGTILNMAKQDGWVTIPLIKSSCSIWMLAGYSPKPGCATWLRWAIREDLSLHPDLTLIESYYQNPLDVPPFFYFETKELRALIHTFRHASQKVVVMGDTFGQTRQPVDCLLASHATLGTCSSPYDQAPISMNDQIRNLAAATGAGFLNTEGWFCALDQCPMVIGHTVAYFDTGHITKEYASELSLPFRSAFLRAATLAKR